MTTLVISYLFVAWLAKRTQIDDPLFCMQDPSTSVRRTLSQRQQVVVAASVVGPVAGMCVCQKICSVLQCVAVKQVKVAVALTASVAGPVASVQIQNLTNQLYRCCVIVHCSVLRCAAVCLSVFQKSTL